MNKRVADVANTLRFYAINDESDGVSVKSREKYREMAAASIVAADDVLFTEENMRAAFAKAGLPEECFVPCMKFAEALRDTAPEVFVVDDMHKAWEEAHEDGFWDGRTKGFDATAPVFEGTLPFPFKLGYRAEEVEVARKAGYAAGFANGVQSNGIFPVGPTLLLGAEHAAANNPYPLPEDNVQEGHTLWCRGGHEGPCRRGVLTGTEKGAGE